VDLPFSKFKAIGALLKSFFAIPPNRGTSVFHVKVAVNEGRFERSVARDGHRPLMAEIPECIALDDMITNRMTSFLSTEEYEEMRNGRRRVVAALFAYRAFEATGKWVPSKRFHNFERPASVDPGTAIFIPFYFDIKFAIGMMA